MQNEMTASASRPQVSLEMAKRAAITFRSKIDTLAEYLQRQARDVVLAKETDAASLVVATFDMIPLVFMPSVSSPPCVQESHSGGDKGETELVAECFVDVLEQQHVECCWSFALAKECIPELVQELVRRRRRPQKQNSSNGDDDDGVNILLLMVVSGDSTQWNRRKAFIVSQQKEVEGDDRYQNVACLLYREILLTSVSLSKSPKVNEVWQHRLWCWKQWVEEVLYHTHHHGLCDSDDAHRIAVLTALLHWAMRCDTAVLQRACEMHPNNLNACQYARIMSSVVWPKLTEHDRACSVGKAPLSWSLAVFEYQLEASLLFLKKHHCDTSCCSFVLDLLRRGFSDSSCMVAAERAWTQVMLLSTNLSSHTAFRGHEALWNLRLGLWTLRLTQPRPLKGETEDEAGSWTVEDELRWVSVHVDGAFGEGEGDTADTCLLAPTRSTLRDACVENSGSYAWNSYFACRYGLALCAMILPAAPSWTFMKKSE